MKRPVQSKNPQKPRNRSALLRSQKLEIPCNSFLRDPTPPLMPLSLGLTMLITTATVMKK